MANLALAEESYFETPADVAVDLLALVHRFVGPKGNPHVVDACAGKGALGGAAANEFGGGTRLSFLELNPDLLGHALGAYHTFTVGNSEPTDVFSAAAASAIRDADLVVMNPPFGGVRGEPLGKTLSILQANNPYPDVGCHYMLRIARLLRPGVPLAFIFRRDAFLSRAYRSFWADLSALGGVIELHAVDRRLKPHSGAAEAVIGVFMTDATSGSCWLRRRSEAELARQGRLLQLGWRRLGSVAKVRAGPSIREELKREVTGRTARRARVIDVPPGHDGAALWGPDFSYEMEWEPGSFSVARNLTCQGNAGFVYKIAASEFRTALLPYGYHFISATPAVIPRRPYDLHFISGCSLLPQWRQLVRDWVASSNFTPGAVEEVFVPFSSFALYRRISRLGELARTALRHAMPTARRARYYMPDTVSEAITQTDDALSAELALSQ